MIGFGAIAVAIVAATAVLVFRRPRIRLAGTTLLWSTRRIPAGRITRAGLVERPPVRTLLLGRGAFLLWPIALDDADGSLDEQQRHALVASLEATAIDLAAVKPDRHDPQGRFAHVGDGSLTRARAIELVAAKARSPDRAPLRDHSHLLMLRTAPVVPEDGNVAVPENPQSVQRAGVRSYSTRRLAMFAAPFGFGFVLIGVVERVASRLIADALGVPLLAVLLAGLLLVAVLIVVAVVVVRRLPPLLVDVSRLELVDGARRYPASSIVAAREQTQMSRVLALSTSDRLITITLESPRRRMSAAQREALAAFLGATAIREPMAVAAVDRQYDPKGRFANVTGNGDLDRDAAVAYVRRTRVQRDETDADAS